MVLQAPFQRIVFAQCSMVRTKAGLVLLNWLTTRFSSPGPLSTISQGGQGEWFPYFGPTLNANHHPAPTFHCTVSNVHTSCRGILANKIQSLVDLVVKLPLVMLLSSCLANSATSTPGMGESTSKSCSSAPSTEYVLAELRRSSKYSFYQLTYTHLFRSAAPPL